MQTLRPLLIHCFFYLDTLFHIIQGEPLLSEAADDEEDSLNDDDSSAVDLEPQHKPSQA